MINEEYLKSLVREIPDFPQPGVLFRDITPILLTPTALRSAVKAMTENVRQLSPDIIVGVESRGFLLGVPIALELGLGFVPVRKPGKLPGDKIQASYALEYGENTLEIHRDAVVPGMRVAIIDDLLATGGTAKATAELVEKLGGTVVGYSFLIELEYLKGRKTLEGYLVNSLLKYE
jgi:adenine phosphoribosyltransferase